MCSDARGEEKKGSQRTTGKPEFARRWQIFKNNLQQPRTLVSLHGFLSFFLSFCVLVGVGVDTTEDRESQVEKYKRAARRGARCLFRVSIVCVCCTVYRAAVSKKQGIKAAPRWGGGLIGLVSSSNSSAAERPGRQTGYGDLETAAGPATCELRSRPLPVERRASYCTRDREIFLLHELGVH